jgi:outer membrane protein assembly factor BamC
MTKTYRLASGLLVLSALAGCSTVNQLLGREETIDYKSSQPARTSLSVPPDLTQVPGNSRYQVPDAPGSTTFSSYSHDRNAQQAARSSGASSTVLPQRDDVQVQRSGDNRWLLVNLPPEQVYDKGLEFWASQGLVVKLNNRAAGIMETDWAENRANIPMDSLRGLVGKVFDQAWDSGIRERFRMRLERAPSGGTEVYITHRQVIEKVISESNVRWVEGDGDPGLDAALLSRFMVFLGAQTDRAAAAAELAQAQQTQPTTAVQRVRGSGKAGALEIDESFDRAWRMVGLGLDRGDFTVEDRDRLAGEYFVRYFDVDAEQQAKPGIFSRIFGSKEKPQSPQYRVKLEDRGGVTHVTVLDSDGKPDTSATAGRILDVLLSQIQPAQP